MYFIASNHENTLRFAKGINPLSGFPQILYDNQWIKICTQGNNTNNLRVICGHKGYYFSAAVRQASSDISTSIGYQIRCNGSEKYVQQCWHALVNISKDSNSDSCKENIEITCTGIIDSNFLNSQY